MPTAPSEMETSPRWPGAPRQEGPFRNRVYIGAVRGAAPVAVGAIVDLLPPRVRFCIDAASFVCTPALFGERGGYGLGADPVAVGAIVDGLPLHVGFIRVGRRTERGVLEQGAFDRALDAV